MEQELYVELPHAQTYDNAYPPSLMPTVTDDDSTRKLEFPSSLAPPPFLVPSNVPTHEEPELVPQETQRSPNWHPGYDLPPIDLDLLQQRIDGLLPDVDLDDGAMFYSAGPWEFGNMFSHFS